MAMADKSEPGNPMKDAGWLALFLIALGVFWFAQGGPAKLSSMLKAPFITPPQFLSDRPSPSRATSASPTSTIPTTGVNSTPPAISIDESLYKGKAFLSAGGARETDSSKEYLEIRAESEIDPMLISGWKLKGRQGLDIAIGSGAYLVYSAQINTQERIYLKGNERAIIASGSSPIGTNFRLNLCTGYFNQFQNFTPHLKEECPRVSDKDLPISFPDACFDFVNNLQTCRMPMTGVPAQAGNDCAAFIKEKANYSGCVNTHKNEPGFYKPEWRVYLNRDKELWGNRDVITLYDQDGKEIDQISY